MENKKSRMDKQTRNAIINKVLKLIKPKMGLVYLSLFMAIGTVILTLYIPVLTGDAIDLMLGKDAVEMKQLGMILLWILAAAGGAALFSWLMNICNNKITYGVVKDLRVRAFNHLQNLPLKYIDSNQYGAVLNNVISDVEQLSDGLLMGFSQFFTGFVTILATLAFMFCLNIWVALVVVILTPLSLVVASEISKRTYDQFSQQSALRGELTSVTEEMISNLKVVQAFNHEDEAKELFGNINEKLKRTSLKATFFSSLTNPATRFCNNLVYAMVAIIGGLMSLGGALTVGSLTAFLSYANQYTKPFNEISNVITELQNALACAERVFKLLEEEEETEQHGARGSIGKKIQGDVEFSKVSFSYIPEFPLIQDLSFFAEPGTKVAIVGPTGSGKSTLINLLMRFYDTQRGSIKIDGTDTKSLTRSGVRQCFGMVLQETWLKTGTIRENIAYGKPNATDEEIEEAARKVHAHGFIKRLPQGYDTMITENGSNLSQGEKQLLCIARVMLALPPMLILDEATSSIDSRTEIKIQQAFDEMMRGRTSFVVAHRLSTIQNADWILVMDEGQIVEQGTHEDLLAFDGFYADLYYSQFVGDVVS